MRTAEGAAALHRICLGAPEVEWTLDASSHFHRLETYFGEELRAAFPPRRRRRQESFLSDPTWLLRDQRVFLRRAVSHFRAKFRCPDALAALWALQRCRPLCVTSCVVAALLCGESRDAAASVALLRSTKQQLRRALRTDKRSWIAELAQQAAETPTRDIVRRLRPLIQTRARGPGPQRGLPVVRLENGALAANEAEALDRWIRHFAANEGGTRCIPGDLVRQVRECADLQGGEPFDVAVGELPSRCHLEKAMGHMLCGKASGPDGIPTELLKYAAGPMAKTVYPLFLKLVLRLEEAVQMKGGVLHHAWKGKHDPTACGSHRALLVSSNIAKAIHGTLRMKCVPSLQAAASPLQVGGLPRFPVLFPAHMARAFQSWQLRTPHAIVFLDLREAFYRVCRPLLSSRSPGDEEVAWIFGQLGLPASVFRSFCAQLARPLPCCRSGRSAMVMLCPGYRDPPHVVQASTTTGRCADLPGLPSWRQPGRCALLLCVRGSAC